MLISVPVLKKYWGVNPSSIVHVGAHNAEELEAYAFAGWGPVTWIEAQPEKVAYLQKIIPSEHKLIEAAVWNTSGESLNLNIMTNTESTSLLALGTHSTEHPDIHLSYTLPIKTKTLSELLIDSPAPDLLALDIQGVELRAIKGYGLKIAEVKWVYCEVNKAELYEGCCQITEIDDYLSQFGFKRAVTRWTIHHWGDALYVNINKTEARTLKQNILAKLLLSDWLFLNTLSLSKGVIRS